MAWKTAAVTAAMLAVCGTAGAAGADPLSGYRGTSRVLVLAAPDADDARLKAQRQALASARTGASERDLVTIEAVGKGAEASALRRHLGLSDDAFRAVLVGKDGGAKLTSAEPIPPQRLFSTIDAMPMRQDEAKRR
ncbi:MULTISPECIES: DUF4174 domain-containing protein [Methylorubrum]|uniref:DUF4174 domain-containing protein n=1 Tax=Methylorubrum TaxID=2282523 RepID=UPI00209EB8DA|nr:MULTISPECIES: DUF4174 domain-containing protein [Methylorubrum]MCP1548121.1 hypothetical protein [Methylorubrum zatmanii]MCP1555264.1 hypothetical protein [Methylorubrum extorquens]MCP1578424.1 hypothetical protein [Methylorubrum extorquens]